MADELFLRLSHNCVETESKRELSRLMDRYFSGAEERDREALERKLGLLTDFIKGSDFGALRSENPVMEGGNGRLIRIYRGDDGIVRAEVADN